VGEVVPDQAVGLVHGAALSDFLISGGIIATIN
jgi:hypothetical protein